MPKPITFELPNHPPDLSPRSALALLRLLLAAAEPESLRVPTSPAESIA